MKIEILLADDQFLILESIKAILESEPKIKVVGTAQDGKTAIALAKELRPDILLIDIEMPQMNGILATKYICKYLPNTKVIVLTSHKDQDYIADALLAGASGYLWKGNLIKDLKQEIYAFGKGYSGVKAKLLSDRRLDAPERTLGDRPTQTDKKSFKTNRVKNRGKIIYFKKYRKKLYIPADSKRKRAIHNIRGVNSSVVKVYSDCTFNPYVTSRTRSSKLKIFSFLGVSKLSRFRRKKYSKNIIWLMLAIFIIVLSIVLF